jgi:tetratricopeptide (TPR) repeat protein
MNGCTESGKTRDYNNMDAMISFPFEIPPSLYSYLEKFDDSPERTTEKLEAHLQRRGQDPIGEFLLAWFYLQQEMPQKARKHAIRAKAIAPGSPLMEYLPYFIRHPESFTAWQPSPASKGNQITELLFAHPRYPHNTDLDLLIEKISKVDPEQLYHPNEDEEAVEGEETVEEEESDMDDIISETMADIYEKQNRFKKALKVYRKLIEYNPEKKDTYEEAIERINKRLEREREQSNGDNQELI